MKRQLVSIALALVLIMQLVLPHPVLSSDEQDLAAKDWLTVYDTTGKDFNDIHLNSYIKIKDAADTEIEPDENGNYSGVPAGAKVELVYAFSLSDGWNSRV